MNGGRFAEAVWFSGPRQVELRRELVAPPGPGQIRVTTIASAISHGTEMLVYRGQVDPQLQFDLPTLAGSFAFPVKYGYACVGQVLDTGPGVNDLDTGDIVFCLHPHQSVFRCPATLATKLPNTIEPELGVFYANLETALNIAHDAPLKLGETAVVFGLGVVGLLVSQMLRLCGATRLIGIDPVESRRALALALGADAALPPGPYLAEELRRLNNGRAADLAVEVSGSPDALQSAIECVIAEGSVIVASWYGRKPVTLDLGGHFHRGRVRLRSSQVGRLNPDLAPRWDYTRRSDTVAALLPRLRLTELIDQRFPLARAADAYSLVDTGDSVSTQVILTYG